MSRLMRPPKTNAAIGTPVGSSQRLSSDGQRLRGVVKRELGCAAGRPDSGVHDSPRQSVRWAGVVGVSPSHHTSPSSVRATLVKIVLAAIAWIALGLLLGLVPGA